MDTVGENIAYACLAEVSSGKELSRVHRWLVVDKNGYRSSDIDAHVNRLAKNELRRVEWTSLKYHCFYDPCCGFDFELDWIVATGGLLSEMVCRPLYYFVQ